MDIRAQVISTIRRQFGGMSEFVAYLLGLGLWASFLIARREWLWLAGLAIGVVIMVIKEGLWQKELRMRRALPPCAIRGISH